ncbi:sulfite exporter TauE/SafE family protein [Helicobacter cetorum]|uniref:sulfite exporter TauE/SafE family protein n=1 Tax=Helicobacter cetorum TaxID=138563 RepID=UPI000CF19DEA|nr:sulfite exporter TauE/SafE family protein [Helicobacter cetorum]
MDIYLLYVVIGLITGVLSGVFGIGGGMVVVPIMLTMGHAFEEAIGVSILQMVFSSLFGSYLNFKKKALDFSLGLYVGVGGLIGASFSGVILKLVSSKILMIIFAFLVLYSIVQFVFKKENSSLQAQITFKINNHKNQHLKLVLIGAITGVFAITLGIGGGMLMVPLMHRFLGYDSKKCVALGLFFVLFSSVSGTLSLAHHQVINHEVFLVGIMVGIGSLIGVSVGIKLVGMLSKQTHKILLLGVYSLSFMATLLKIFSN